MEPNQLLVLGVPGPELTAAEIILFRNLQPGGFLLEAAGLGDVAQTRRVTEELRALSVGEPFLFLRSGGDGVCPTGLLNAPDVPPARLRDAGDSKRIMTAAWITGRLLRVLGFNAHLSPDLAIGAWGRDDQEVINNAGTFNRYQRKQGILGCGFPFPGGMSCADLDAAALLRSPLLPFTALMPELDGMLADNTVFPNIDPEHPACRSHSVITRLLRDQLGYKRLVLADTNDAAAIMAGADLVIEPDIGHAPETLSALSSLSGYTLSEAIDRIEYAKKRLHKPTKATPKILDRLEEDAQALVDLL